ncbi:MAG: hypothetical protein Q7R97_00385 [Candidatus Daviesbacteria bacterium]|nr:hypothetical protein [Candidatus Daviesbacteria bacterium]
MKIILLFGPGEVSKRNSLLKLKKEFSGAQISLLDLKQDSIADLELKIFSGSLFETGERLVVVENVPDKMDLETLRQAQGRQSGQVTLVLVAGHPAVTSVILKSAKKLEVKIYNFEGEREITAFPFLDNLIEGKKQVYLELEKLLLEYGVMYVLTMIYYLLRRNILPLPSSDFMRKKIQKQKIEFNEKDFENFYRKTLETEYKIKAGLMPEQVALTCLVRQFT